MSQQSKRKRKGPANTIKSSFKKKIKESTLVEMASLLECPVCMKHILPPVWQCTNGHLICAQCKTRLEELRCPLCRIILGNDRNMMMEELARKIMFPCTYASSGCTVALLHTEKLNHENTCEFRSIMCPCQDTSCNWQGMLDEVMPHIDMYHKNIKTLEGEDIVLSIHNINHPGPQVWIMIQICFSHNFMVVVKKQEVHNGNYEFFVIVQLIGLQKEAQNFNYTLDLRGNEGHVTWQARPLSIHENVSSAILNFNCFKFDTYTAQQFTENQELKIDILMARRKPEKAPSRQ